MKRNHNILTAMLLTGLAIVFTLASCQKSFDPKSYAPKKPAPTFGGYSSSSQIWADSLVAYWPFDGSLADSLSSTTGVATGATSFTKGVKGQGLQGVNNGYVLSDVPPAVQALKHNLTLSLWVNMPQNTNGAVGLIDMQNNQAGDPGFWGSMAVFFDNGGTATTGVLKVHLFSNPGGTGLDAWEGGYTVTNPWNTWINVTVTFDEASSLVTVYYNGTSIGTNTVAGFNLNWTGAKKMVFGTLQFQTTPSLTISTGQPGWASFQVGVTDQVRIYNKALSATEVSALYNLENLGR